jgi:hypothetical protein
MTVFNKIVKIFMGISLSLCVIFGLIGMFGNSDYDLAVEKLTQFQKQEHEVIIKTCKSLLNLASSELTDKEFDDSISLKGTEQPKELMFIKADFIRYNSRICTIFLYKVPGKGIGYTVTKQSSNEFKLQWFNDFKSWDRHDIVMHNMANKTLKSDADLLPF